MGRDQKGALTDENNEEGEQATMDNRSWKSNSTMTDNVHAGYESVIGLA